MGEGKRGKKGRGEMKERAKMSVKQLMSVGEGEMKEREGRETWKQEEMRGEAEVYYIVPKWKVAVPCLSKDPEGGTKAIETLARFVAGKGDWEMEVNTTTLRNLLRVNYKQLKEFFPGYEILPLVQVVVHSKPRHIMSENEKERVRDMKKVQLENDRRREKIDKDKRNPFWNPDYDCFDEGQYD